MTIARTLALSLLMLAAIAVPADAAVTISGLTLQPSTTQAGAHPDVTIDTTFAQSPTSDDVKSLRVVLPQGLVGNPNAATRCSASALQADTCPASSKVGTTEVSALVTVAPGMEVPQTSSGDVYDLETQPGDAARIGVVVRPAALGLVALPKIVLQSPITLGPDTNYGLASLFDNLPRTSGPFDIRITELKLTLNGSAAKGPFVTNPTDCSTGTMTATATSYDAPGSSSSANASLTPTGCGTLPFAPMLSGTLGGAGQTDPGSSPALTTVITVPPGQANPSSVTVTLPSSVANNASQTGRFCPAAEVTAGTCPPSATIGQAIAASPLLTNALSGPVLAGVDPQTGGPDLVVQLGGIVPLTLFGRVGITPTGISNTFAGIPDLPLSRFQLTVFGGANGFLSNNRDLCAAATSISAQAQLVSHSGRTVNLAAPLTVQGCGQATAGAATTPRATLGLSFRRGLGTLTSKISSASGGPRLRRVLVTLPAGLRLPATKGGTIVSAAAAGRRLSSRAVKVRGRTIQITMSGRGAARISLRSTGIQAVGSLNRRLRSRPRLSFRVLLTSVPGKRTSLALRLRPVVR